MTSSMNKHSLKKAIQRFYKSRLQALQECDPEDLRKPAIVFSPHQDDETLGCGGTIIRARKAGARVKVVYLTDGSAANFDLIDFQKLMVIREKEALAATQILGLTSGDIVFLRFKDGKLQDFQQAAIKSILKILVQEQPEVVFIPYHREPSFIPDHTATNQIVLAALKQLGIEVIVYEYPIWLWHHYPWIALNPEQRKGLFGLMTLIKNGLMSLHMSFRLLKDFRYCVDIKNCIIIKHEALYEHKSQMTQFISDPRWLSIPDISNGEFFECFIQEREIFYRYSLKVKS